MADAEVPELAPRAFRRALLSVREALVRPEVEVSPLTAPSRMAPWAAALAATVAADAEPGRPWRSGRVVRAAGGLEREPGEDRHDDLASGRFVLLHDPAGPPAWGGTFRVVVYLRATLEADLVHDPLVAEVAWSWLVDALDAASAHPLALGGTVTRVSSQSFGKLAEPPGDGPGGQPGAEPMTGDLTAETELRASWTPPSDAVGASVSAWAEVVATAAGLAPLPEGVLHLPRRLP